MVYSDQQYYISAIHNHPRDMKVLILEDSYSTMAEPDEGRDIWQGFKKLDKADQARAMAVMDWIANRVLARRPDVAIPCAYRTLEEWNGQLQAYGYKVLKTQFIGFPENRDIHTPQSLLVAKTWQ